MLSYGIPCSGAAGPFFLGFNGFGLVSLCPKVVVADVSTDHGFGGGRHGALESSLHQIRQFLNFLKFQFSVCRFEHFDSEVVAF